MENEKTLREILTEIDKIEDDQEFSDKEYEAVQSYCINKKFELSDDDMEIIHCRYFDTSFENWKEFYAEPFYTEEWYEEDILNAAEELETELSKADIEIIKRQIITAFDDKSYRNEIISHIIEEYKGEDLNESR